MNKTSKESDAISVELFKILKDDAVINAYCTSTFDSAVAGLEGQFSFNSSDAKDINYYSTLSQITIKYYQNSRSRFSSFACEW